MPHPGNSQTSSGIIFCDQSAVGVSQIVAVTVEPFLKSVFIIRMYFDYVDFKWFLLVLLRNGPISNFPLFSTISKSSRISSIAKFLRFMMSRLSLSDLMSFNSKHFADACPSEFTTASHVYQFLPKVTLHSLAFASAFTFPIYFSPGLRDLDGSLFDPHLASGDIQRSLTHPTRLLFTCKTNPQHAQLGILMW